MSDLKKVILECIVEYARDIHLTYPEAKRVIDALNKHYDAGISCSCLSVRFMRDNGSVGVFTCPSHQGQKIVSDYGNYYLLLCNYFVFAVVCNPYKYQIPKDVRYLGMIMDTRTRKDVKLLVDKLKTDINGVFGGIV